MIEHQNAVENLVQESRQFIAAYNAHQEENNMFTFLFAVAAIGVVAYMLGT